MPMLPLSNDVTIDEARGLIYRMLLRMDNNTILVNGRGVKLQPEMAVTAKVQTDKRRIIEFLMTPILRGVKESMRER